MTQYNRYKANIWGSGSIKRCYAIKFVTIPYRKCQPEIPSDESKQRYVRLVS